jgi:hypothetical protein
MQKGLAGQPNSPMDTPGDGSFVHKVRKTGALSVFGRLREVRKITLGKSEKWRIDALTSMLQTTSLAMNPKKVMNDEPNPTNL